MIIENPEKKVGLQQGESVGQQYEKAHARIKELLGDAYNESKIDTIAGVMGFEQVLREIGQIRSSTNPIQRRRYISDWYKSHKEILKAFEEVK